jgi:uncharacterized protein
VQVCLPEFEVLNVPLTVGVVADTHRSSRAARALPIGLLRGLEHCDVVFHAGDVNAPWVLRELENIAPVRAVRGNNEEPPLIHDLPADLYFRAGPFRIGMMHGHIGGRTARENTALQMRGVVDLAIYGHSHIPEATTRDGLKMVNPGSPTQRRYQPSHTFAIVTIADTIKTTIVALD